jgi:hypothetical protein
LRCQLDGSFRMQLWAEPCSTAGLQLHMYSTLFLLKLKTNCSVKIALKQAVHCNSELD